MIRDERGGRRVEGFAWAPMREFIYVADFGQPDKTPSGIYIGDYDFGGYKFDTWRYGEVIAIGPGRLSKKGHRVPITDIELGDVILFSRKHGTRLPGEVRYQHPKYPGRDGLLVRVLDPMKTVAVVDDFEPWWNVLERQLDPGIHFSG